MSTTRSSPRLSRRPVALFALLNAEHRCSPHRDILDILSSLRIPFQRVRDVPSTCKRPVVVRPENPAGWRDLAWAAGLALVLVLGAAAAVKYARRP